MLDKQTRLEIAQVVSQAARDAYLLYNEEWISGKELCKQFQQIPKSWLKANKHLLPQSSVRYIDKNGNIKETLPAYPKHKINQMIMEGQLDFTKAECQYRRSNKRSLPQQNQTQHTTSWRGEA